jgi:hypothetical protein
VTELAPEALVWAALQEAVAGPLSALRSALPAKSRPQGPSLEPFDMGSIGGNDLSAFLLAQRDDDRYLFWQVEVWIREEGPPRGWSAVVKGEIDLDGVDGNPRCVLNQQVTALSSEGAVEAIRDLAQLVCAYPVGDLMTMSPPTDDED